MFKEFKEFAMRGNVVDLAVGVIIGAAFGKIVDSLVKDIIMPPIGLLLGKVDFANLYVLLKQSDKVPGPYPTLEAAQKSRCRDIELWSVSECGDQFLDCGVCGVPDRQRHQ